MGLSDGSRGACAGSGAPPSAPREAPTAHPRSSWSDSPANPWGPHSPERRADDKPGARTATAVQLRQWANGPYDLKECQNPQLVERALRASRQWLADTPQVPAQLSVLGIADLNPANVLWDGSVCRLVDFEDGGLSELAFELADHVEHLAGRDVYDADTLVDAVGLTKDEKERFAHWRCHWAIFWLLMLLPGNSGFLRNPPGTTEAQAERVLRMLADEPGQTPAGTAETV